MRLHTFYTLLVCALFIACDNDDYPNSKVPSVVLNSFRTQFSNATDIQYNKLGEHYEIEFEIEHKDAGTILDSAGSIVKERREISWKDLPAEIQNSLDKAFGRDKIEDPEVIEAGDKVYYQVQIKRFLFDKKVVLDGQGKPDASMEYWN